MKVLKNHTNNSQFFLQFFKHVDECDCRACELDLWKPRRLPAPIFEAVHTSLRLPLPIPQPQPETGALGTKEFHYMTLEEAFQHGVFTDEHQPSKIAERAAGRGRDRGHGLAGAAPAVGRGRGRPPVAPTAEAVPAAQPKAVHGNALSSRVLVQPHMKGMSIAHPSKLRGVVEADCGKPRCIFSQPLSKMVPPAAENVTPEDPKSAASKEVEWEYYTHLKKSVAWFNPDLCVHCVGQLGAGWRHKDLHDVYHVVLPICEACEADGLKHNVPGFKPNGEQKLKNTDKHLAGQALARMRGGHPQQGATAPTASASASAASAATTAAAAESATGGD
eukprot:jgi/Tetstr1/423189/TSEL_001309.t1